MTIHHRISLNAIDARPILKAHGLEFALATDGFYLFEDVSEDSELWCRLEPALLEYQRIRATALFQSAAGVDDFIWSEFDEPEREAAQFLIADASIIGFPHPRESYRKIVYAGGCDQCSSGQEQVSDFELSPSSSRKIRPMFQLNWVEDELFVSRDVYLQVFKNFGIEARRVRRRGQPLEDTLQLVVPDSADVSVKDVPYKTCSRCGVKTHQRIVTTYAPSPTSMPSSAMFRSKQRFHAYYSAIYMSQELYRATRSLAIRGVGFWPCAGRLISD